MKLSAIYAAMSGAAASMAVSARPLIDTRRSAHDPSRKERELYYVARRGQHPRPNTSRPHTVGHNGTAFVYPGTK